MGWKVQWGPLKVKGWDGIKMIKRHRYEWPKFGLSLLAHMLFNYYYSTH